MNPEAQSLISKNISSTIKEGVKIYNDVFYDPKYHFFNDMSISIINHFIKSFIDKNSQIVHMIDTHSTSAVRAIRYLKELEIDHILLNNQNSSFNDIIKRNFILNNIDNNFTITTQDPRTLLYHHNDFSNNEFSKKLYVIDINPENSASLYLESSIESITDGSMICITAKDIDVLSGIYPEKCLSQYESYPVKNRDYCHELAIRILLFTLSKNSAMHKRIIKPLVSYYSDGYIRIYVQVLKSRGDIYEYPFSIGYVEQCSQCNTYNISPLTKNICINSKKHEIFPNVHSNCTECGSYLRLGGPIWIDSINDKQFISSLISNLKENDYSKQLNNYKKMMSLLDSINEEINFPLFYSIPSICKKLHVRIPNNELLKEIIMEKGYEVSNSHIKPNSIKTNAPSELLWDIFRNWYLIENPSNKIDKSSAIYNIISKEPKNLNSFNNSKYIKSRNNKLINNYIEKKYYNTCSKILRIIKK